ncbi:hypothetical protein MRX96_024009 [Rhipicephalus microplus]
MQRVMRRTFDGLPRTATYMDDVGQGATTVREAFNLLNEALRRVVINGLKMDLRKCQLIQDKVSLLGYVISAEGRTLDESRVAAVEKFKPHRNAKKLYSFLQFANHYRKFIPEFAKVTHKLRHLLVKDVLFVWTDAHEATVSATKHRHSGHSPFRLMHGYDPKLPGELNLASVEGDIDESHRLHDLARGRAETRERLLQSQHKTTI